MKILYFTKYSRNAGSSRLRSYQYFPWLEKADRKVEVSPLFSETYLQQLYAGKSTTKEALKGYFKRLIKLFSLGKYDHIVIEKELFPYLPAFAEWFLQKRKVAFITDYDDAIFHNYDQSTQPVIRKVLENKIAHVMRYSAQVVVGNGYLAEYAQRAGAKKIEIIPTVIDLERYPQKKDSGNTSVFVWGWIGTKSTFEKHLVPHKNGIIQFLQENPDSEFHIIGIPENQNWHERVKWIPWREDTEITSIQKLDVGIMPLQDSLWEKGKCAYKLIQYAACGIPGIASDVGMNKEITIPEKTGYLATTDEDWIKHLLDLKNNPSKRQEMGENARKLVEEKYCLQVTAKKWLNIL